MLQPFNLTNEICVFREVQRPFIRAQEKISTHAGREINHHVRFALANTLDHLAIEFHPATGPAAVRFTHAMVRSSG